MKFLRRYKDTVESVYTDETRSATERAHALHVLRGCVVIARHPYQRSPHSSAGNCWCGRHAGSPLHHIVKAEQ